MKIAVIDIGTNSVHMLMAEILPNFTFKMIGREKEMIRLGDATLTQGYLSEALMDLGLTTLKKFKYLAQSKGVNKFYAVATSAVREAQNGGDFLQRVRRETGIRARIITGEQEGRLIYLGVKHSMPLAQGNTLLIDIGGGSVELLVINPQEILFVASLKLGAARLHDQFLKKYRSKEFEAMEAHIKEQLLSIQDSILELGFEEVIGTSGTLLNLAAMAHYGRNDTDEPVGRLPSVSLKELKEIYQVLKETTPEERLTIKGLDSRRSDIILGGAASAWLIGKSLGVEQITLCDKALREGMVYHYIQKNRLKIRSEAEIPDVRKRSVLKLAHQCDYDREHAHQTAKLALQLFDRTLHLHHLSSLDRELLEYAALLHDIGYSISYDKHHRHAFYLIKNVRMDGFSEEEIHMMALTARYHRRSIPKKSHRWYSDLPKGARGRVKWLIALLKLADALDRSHFSVVDSVRLRTYDHKIIFQIEAVDDAEYEIWEAKNKTKLFETLTGRVCEFKVKSVAKRQGIRRRQRATKLRAIS